MGKHEDKVEETEPTQSQHKAPRKRRWLRRLVIILAVIGVLVFVSPYVISSGPVLGWILSSFNGGIRGTVAVDELSLGWLSPISAKGIVVLDAQRRQVLSVPEVRAAKGLLGLAADPMAFGQIELDDPNVVLHKDAYGQFSLVEAFESTGPPSPAEPSGELPRLRGIVIVRKASVTFVDPNGRRMVLGADSKVDIQTLDRLAGTSTTRLPNGGVLQTKYDLAGLIQDGRFQPGQISGTMHIWTEKDKSIDLKPLGSFALPGKGLAGKLAVNVDFTLDRGRPKGDLRLSFTDLQAAEGYAGKVQPVSFELTGRADHDGNSVAGDMHLVGDPNLPGDLGRFDGTYKYRHLPMPELTPQKLLAALLTGEELTLPEMSLDAGASINLVALTKALPSLVEIRKDVTITGGTLWLKDLVLRGGAEREFRFDAGFADVRGNRAVPTGEPEKFELEPITMKLASALVAGSGLTFRQLLLQSSFAQLDGKGTPKDFQANFNADLAKARTEVGKVIDLEKYAWAGAITGNLRTQATGGDKAIVVTGLLNGADLAVDGNSLLPAGRKLRLDLTGLDVGPEPGRFVLKGVSVDFGQILLASGTGQFDANSGALTANATIDRGDIAGLLRTAQAFGVKLVKPVTGSLAGKIDATRESSTGPIVVGGAMALIKLRIDGKPVGLEQATFKPDISIDPSLDSIRIVAASLESDAIALTASGTVSKLAMDKLLDIRGHYRGQWDKIMAIAHELVPETKDVVMAGPLESDFTLTGPAARPTLTPVYRNMQAKAGVGWQTARLMGFELSKADMPITFKDGRIVVPATQILAPGGKVNLAATVDLSEADPRLLMPGKLVVLDNLEINREVGRKVLSRLNPIFGQLLSLQGRITLVTTDIDVPLGEAIKKRGTGSGHVDLTGLQFEPDGLMAALLELGGLGGKQLVQVGAADFVIKDGAIRYENFAMTFGKSFELIFRGAVRFDDSVDMVVSMPVRAALLKKLGVGGSAAQYAALLEGARIDLPIVGTREKPGLDFAKVDIRPLIKKAAEKMLKKKAGGLLDGILGSGLPGSSASDGQPDQSGPATQKAPGKPEDMLIKGVFDALGDWGKDKDKDKK